MVDSSWSDDNDAYDNEQQGVTDFEDADSPEEVLADSCGTATVNDERVNNAETDGHGTDEADSDGSHPRCSASEDDENGVQYENIPDKLTDCDRWVCWRVECRECNEVYELGVDECPTCGDEPTKVPVNAETGYYAKSNDESTWASFEQACDHYETHDEIEGIGFMFSRDGRFAGVDLDKCVEPETGDIEPWARDIVERLDSYTEFSPSGTGLHVIVEGLVPSDGSRSGNVEMYDETRYFTFTGDVGMGAPKGVEKRVAELRDVHADYIQDEEGDDEDTTDGSDGGHDGVGGTDTSEPVDVDLSDEELLRKAKNAENGDYFEDLWNGNWEKHAHRWTPDSKDEVKGTHSEADSALCTLLAFWTGGDRARIDDLFRQSGLMRSKWDEQRGSQTYGDRTIDNALSQVTEYYDPDESGSVDMDAVLEEMGDGETPDAEDVSNWVSKAGVKHISGLGEDDNISDLNDREKAACVWELIKKSDEHHVRCRREDGTFWAYDDGVWQYDDDRTLRHAARKALGPMNYGDNVLKELKSQVRGDIHAEVEGDELGLDTGMLAVENGLLNLDEAAEGHGYDALRELRPDDHALVRLPVEYDPDADYDEWHDRVEEWAEEGRADALQEYVGYCLHVGGMPIHRALLIVGGGANGKSTFLEVVKSLLGEENITSTELQTLANEDYAKAEFEGKLANIDEDLSSRKLGHGIGMFKKLIAGNRIRARRPYESEFSFSPAGKQLYAANEVPDVGNDVADDDEGFWRRWLLVEFPNHYSVEERDPQLTDRLTGSEELSAVLNWAIEGRRRLLEQGYFTGEYRSAFKKRDRWRAWGDSLEEFIAGHVVHEDDADNVSTSYAHKRYQAWCRENDKEAVGQRKFTTRLRDTEMDVGYEQSVRTEDGVRNGYKHLGFSEDVPELGTDERSDGQEGFDDFGGGK